MGDDDLLKKFLDKKHYGDDIFKVYEKDWDTMWDIKTEEPTDPDVELRAEHPALQDAWEKYQVIKKLVQE